MSKMHFQIFVWFSWSDHFGKLIKVACYYILLAVDTTPKKKKKKKPSLYVIGIHMLA